MPEQKIARTHTNTHTHNSHAQTEKVGEGYVEQLTVKHDFSRFARSDAFVRRAGGHGRLLSRVAFIESLRVDLDDVERT